MNFCVINNMNLFSKTIRLNAFNFVNRKKY